MGLFSRKSVGALQESGKGYGSALQRHHNAFSLASMGIAAIVGVGIFVLTGTAAASYAGPGIIISFVLAGIVCLCTGLCYAELASMIPVSGSAYSYAYATLGELPAWIVGWALILEYLLASATISVGWSGYFTEAMRELGWIIPHGLSSAPFAVDASGQLVRTGALVNLPAVFFVTILSAILYVGIRESARFTNAMVFVKLTVVLLVIGFGIWYVNPDNWHPLIPENTTGEEGKFGWSGIVRGTAVVFFAYLGFDTISTGALEAKNPQRDIPAAIVGALLVCTLLYILMSAVMTGLAHYTELNVPHPVFIAISKAGPALSWLAPIVNWGAIAGLTSGAMSALYAQTRVFYVMSHDGLVPSPFGLVHSKYRTPWVATIAVFCVVSVIGGLFPIGLLGELVSFGTFLALIAACIAVIVMRLDQPDAERPFKIPAWPLVTVLGILSCGYLMLSLGAKTWQLGLGWMVLGLAVYTFYGRRKSVLRMQAAEQAAE